jgi:quercetin dioxygenase-like cupin family protein
MLTRRIFGGCAVCAAVGLAASGGGAQAQPAQTPGVTRTVVQTTDLDEKTATLLVIADIAAGVAVARHTHPGVESAFVVEGGFELSVQGQPAKRVRAGEGFQISPGTPHSVQNGDRPTKLAITYVVEKGKPLASPA